MEGILIRGKVQRSCPFLSASTSSSSRRRPSQASTGMSDSISASTSSSSTSPISHSCFTPLSLLPSSSVPAVTLLPDSITAQVLAAKRATGFNYNTIQLQQYSITAEFNYIHQHYNQPNRA
ncbi:hypothetical protein LXL04_001790 [Taraxacum kok-saghyz]